MFKYQTAEEQYDEETDTISDVPVGVPRTYHYSLRAIGRYEEMTHEPFAVTPESIPWVVVALMKGSEDIPADELLIEVAGVLKEENFMHMLEDELTASHSAFETPEVKPLTEAEKRRKRTLPTYEELISNLVELGLLDYPDILDIHYSRTVALVQARIKTKEAQNEAQNGKKKTPARLTPDKAREMQEARARNRKIAQEREKAELAKGK